ncbi:MAG: type II secretion system F family protein [Oscillospiraceae bacterium]|nr:type II secretion system F family protein [Oscillospiraceae bacterium]
MAVDAVGKEYKGVLDRPSREEAMDFLRKKDYTVVSLNDALAISKDISLSFLDKKPSPRDMSVFCRQFVSISKAGVPVVATLDMLSEQTENKMLRKAVRETKIDVEKGETLADAMRVHKKCFPELFVTMVEAGEASGSLDTSFTRGAEQFEKDAKIRGLMKKATTYPAVLGVVAVAVVILMLMFVIPTFEDMFVELDTELPGITVAVLTASRFMMARWYVVLVVVIAIVVVVRLFRASMAGKRFFSFLAMHLPLFGPLTVKTAASRMSRTLSTLLAAGIPMLEAIEITISTMSNELFKDTMRECKDDVTMGSAISESLKRSDMFPPLVTHMVKIGEETGAVENMLTKLADYYDEEVENATAQIMAAMEPMIIVVMAGIVGTLVISVLMPMAEMYNSLGNL